jgi:predicted DNA-binding WGR domain protein
MDSVAFVDRDTYKPIKLGDVPPAIFSEAMRDIDLVVSVAHRGEVDPEASESTVEMRATLVRETCQLLGLKNVQFKPQHVVIDGHYGEYSLHLGSGGIHRLPGGSLSIIAVGAQHRGRIFLPFADDDPKTAEIVSKVLLLARDEEIMDPTILDQLGAPAKLRPASLTDKAASDSAQASKSETASKRRKAKSDESVAGNIAAVTGKRRFEFSEGKSNKFWEIEISGDSLTTTWGRIGTNGQSKTKQYASTQKAEQEYAKLIEDKTNKGYQEV